MTRRSITAGLGSLLIAISVVAQSPVVRAYEPCDGQADNRCIAASAPSAYDGTTQQIVEFDGLAAITPGVTMADAAPIINIGAPCITDGQANCAVSPAHN